MTENSHKISVIDGVRKILFDMPVGVAEIFAAFNEIKDAQEDKWLWVFAAGGSASSDALRDYTRYAVSNMSARDPRRVAIVTPADFAFGMARMQEAFSEMEGSQDEHEVFRNESDAFEWLHKKDDI